MWFCGRRLAWHAQGPAGRWISHHTHTPYSPPRIHIVHTTHTHTHTYTWVHIYIIRVKFKVCFMLTYNCSMSRNLDFCFVIVFLSNFSLFFKAWFLGEKCDSCLCSSINFFLCCLSRFPFVFGFCSLNMIHICVDVLVLILFSVWKTCIGISSSSFYSAMFSLLFLPSKSSCIYVTVFF